ncbi:MAG: sigma-54 dependent transcriptional regulator [bacterium]
MNETILVVDDKESVRNLLASHLKEEGFNVEAAASGEEALERFSGAIYDVVITDMRMPGMDGMEVIRAVREISPDTVIVVITAYAEMENAIAAMKLGAYEYLKKPFKLEEVQAAVEKALQTSRLLRENRLLRREVERKSSFDRIVARSRAMQAVFTKIEKVASTSSTVLITGETGTGKELVARAIHYNSPRRERPFVVVDCAAIPATLLESELFGYAKGAFTGAIAAKKGMFEVADGSTILRVLQDGEIYRIGETTPHFVDVRIVAATNRDLDEEVAAERFRKDLFFRINVFPIHLPPLRERREDIPILVNHFTDTFCRENQKPIKTFSPAALNLLFDHPWHGNVRELQNIVERSILLTEGDSITPDDLPVEVLHRKTFTEKGRALPLHALDDNLSLKENISTLIYTAEKELIQRALEKANQNRNEAARMLGISRRALFYKLKEYDL